MMDRPRNCKQWLQTLRVLALVSLLAGIWGCQTAKPVAMQRLDFGHLTGPIPGWTSDGSPSPLLRESRLQLRGGSRLSHAVELADYPVALQLNAQLGGGTSALAVVTRASDDRMGPLGFPRRGVAFVLWDESVCRDRPFNAQVLRIEDDRLIPLGRERVALRGESVRIDVYDDGAWILFGVDGEVIVAREPSLPTSCRLGNDPMWMPTVVRHLWHKISPPERVPAPREGDLVVTTPLGVRDAGFQAAISDLALLRRAPAKSDEERARWEELAGERPLRWPRPIQGQLCDVQTGMPIVGAMLTPVGSAGRNLLTDDFGEFVETQVPEGEPSDWAMTLNHPDYPAITLRREAPGEFTHLSELLEAEGEGVLTLRFESDPDDSPLLRRVTLRPQEEGRLPRHHPTPPPLGPMVFRQLPPGTWRVEVDFAEPGIPRFLGQAFEVTGAALERTERLSH